MTARSFFSLAFSMRIPRVGTGLRSNSKIHTSCLTNADTAPVLHVFRALLRECTYLPDPSARQFFHAYIVARFHANKTHPPSQQGRRSKRGTAILNRRPQLLKKAQKSLKTICRANYGHFEPLSKILAMTYGRVGPRRHELMQRLTNSDPALAENTQELAQQLKGLGLEINFEDPALAEILRGPEQWREDIAKQEVPQPSPQLDALIRSQATRRESLLPRKPLKRVTPRIPETNVWGRPTPMKRVRNIKRRWYADVLSRVMPPLPEAEWEMLRKKAFGEIYLQRPLRRRGPSGESNIGQETYKSDDQMKRPHNIHSRFMRRLWANVFQQCPLMKRDSTKSFGWHVIWSDVKTETGIGLDSMLVAYKDAFDGRDENGRLKVSEPG